MLLPDYKAWRRTYTCTGISIKSVRFLETAEVYNDKWLMIIAGLSVLFVGYILGQVPSNLVMNHIGRPSLYLGFWVSFKNRSKLRCSSCPRSLPGDWSLASHHKLKASAAS